MMVLLRLFYEFFKTGLFSVGGGMATTVIVEKC
jgi:chromate transporter